MWTRGVIFLIGSVFICTQILHSQHASAVEIYIAELMVESNVTLETKVVLTVLNNITTLTVTENGEEHEVTILGAETLAECLIVGVDTSCNCSAGYIWSNDVCYSDNYNDIDCCREATCNQNVSHITPLCIPKVPIYINGSATLFNGTWTTDKTTTLTAEFQKLNGFESLNLTGTSGLTSEFEVGLSVKFDLHRIENIVQTLQTLLQAVVLVDTTGMVNMEYPENTVCYQSSPTLRCTFDQPTHEAGWNMSTTFQRFELFNGSVVEVHKDCRTAEFPSCVAVTLKKVTGVWEGTYECGFTKGLVRHIAKGYLSVARLPDFVQIKTDPITGDCSNEDPNTGFITIKVKTTILKTNNSYTFGWIYNNKKGSSAYTDDGTNIIYSFDVDLSCVYVPTPQMINVTFTNEIPQTRNDYVIVPVIYEGGTFCEAETLNGQTWPKTPDKDTAVNKTCPVGKVGYRERTCNNKVWGEVFDKCVSEEIDKISTAAEGFEKGLGATEEVAVAIFSDLKSTTSGSVGDSENMADVLASVTVLDTMARASNNVELGGSVVPSLVAAASNMLNGTWTKVNESVRHNMSANYLVSLEGLVKNIGMGKGNNSGNSSDFNSDNVDLKYCGTQDCTMEVFGIVVNMNITKGVMKTLGVRKLMPKLRNTFKNTESTGVLTSTTLEYNENGSVIKMEFPVDVEEGVKPYCVFFDTHKGDFSDRGCRVVKKEAAGNISRRVFCECDHLTSFSVLMARGDVSTPELDVITYIGLAISIVSLIIFLIIEYLVWAAVVKTKLSHYRHTAMVNIAFFLLLADICFLASVEPTKISYDMCLALTLCKHFFFMVKFCWMLCLSAMLVHQLIFVFNPLRKKVFMYLSSIVGYIVPILIVGSTYVYYKYTNKPYHNEDTCWLTYERLLVGSLHAFVLPIGAILLSNIFSLGVVIVTLLKSSKNDSSKTDEKDTAKSIIKVLLVLAPVFGVTWSIGFCLVVFETTNPAYPFFNYTFTIVNSFQGFFVLLTGFMAEQKVKDELYKIITGNKKGSSDSTKNLTSTMYTKDK